MAKPNYQFEKRQRDLAKKIKQEEKRRQKLAAKTAADGSGVGEAANTDAAASGSDEVADAPPDRGTTPEP